MQDLTRPLPSCDYFWLTNFLNHLVNIAKRSISPFFVAEDLAFGFDSSTRLATSTRSLIFNVDPADAAFLADFFFAAGFFAADFFADVFVGLRFVAIRTA
jgi:hypothetical protein